MKFDMVFEGGGAKGMVFVGAMQALERHNHEVGRLLGTSAGAITATFLAAGFTPHEMLDILSETGADGQPVFTSFMGVPQSFTPEIRQRSVLASMLQRVDIPLLPEALESRLDKLLLDKLMESRIFRHFFSFVEQGGWYSADAFVNWCQTKLDTGEFNGQPRRFSQMTFAEFFAATGRHLTLIGADISGNQILVLNHTTAPDCPVVWGVRMSMSIPMLWQEVIWRQEWGLYRGKDISGHAIVDGGLLSNFPIELFLSKQPAVEKIMGAQDSDMIIGCLIDEARDVPGAPPKPGESAGGINYAELPVLKRLLLLVDTVTSAHDKMVIEGVENLVVRLPAKGYGTTEFDMDVARREALMAAGDAEMEQFLKRVAAMAVSFSVTPSYNDQRVDDSALKILADE